jgi:hypothetical protein
MMSRDRHSEYRGSKVTVRWTESKSESSRGCVYIASYMLTSEDGKKSFWRHFHALKFHTSYTAVAYALREAHRSIDAERPALPIDDANGSAPH